MKHVRTSVGWLYLALVIDLFSGRVFGCAMYTEEDGELSIVSLTSALEARGNPQNVLVHSDRGGICGDDEYVKEPMGTSFRAACAVRAAPGTTR